MGTGFPKRSCSKESKASSRFGREFGTDRLQAAKPAFALMERGQRFLEIFAPKIRPHPLGEMQFGVGTLPKQEVGQPLFAAGPDHEVDVSKPGFTGDELGKYLAAEIAYP